MVIVGSIRHAGLGDLADLAGLHADRVLDVRVRERAAQGSPGLIPDRGDDELIRAPAADRGGGRAAP
jgi:hypothetical protein